MFQIATDLRIPNPRMSWSNPLRFAIILLLMCQLTGILGCSTGLGNTSNHQITSAPSHVPSGKWTDHHKQLVQQGRFTEAAMFSSLYDSTSWQSQRENLGDSKEQQENVESHSKEKIKKVKTEALRKVNFPKEHNQKTSLDGKWHTHLGWTLMLNGNYTGAAAAYREALRQNGTLAQAYLGLGITLRNEGQIKRAIEAYQKALEFQPRYAAALVHLGYIYADGHQGKPNFEKAEGLFHQASRQGDPFATIALLDLRTRVRE